MWLVPVSPLGPLLVLLAPDAGARPILLPTPTAIAQESRYRLRPTRDGGFDYEDTRFKAVIAPDGRVSFNDRHVASKWHLIPFFPKNHPPGTPTLESTLKDLLRRRPPEPPPRAEQPLPSRPRPSGPLTERDRRRMEEYNNFMPLTATTGTADLTDEYYRMLGEDPYRYEKAKFLSNTFDMRLKMAAESQVHDLRRSLHDLPSRLEQLWQDTSLPPAARRLIICSLYRELGDDRSLEPSRVITHFVRTRLPLGSPDAYTPAELEACTAGLDKGRRWSPYDVPAPTKLPPARKSAPPAGR
jgi:hypothetical protein